MKNWFKVLGKNGMEKLERLENDELDKTKDKVLRKILIEKEIHNQIFIHLK